MQIEETRRSFDFEAIATAVRRISLVGLAFIVGGIYGSRDLQPIKFLADGFSATQLLIFELTQSRPLGLDKIEHQGSGVVAYDPDQAFDGLTLVQGILPGGPQVRLIDMDGNEIHRWKVDFFNIWDNPKHIVPAENVPTSDLNYHTMGFVAHRDGSLVAIVGDKGAVKLDRCGAVEWKLDRMVHHSVTLAADGGYWIPAHTPADQLDAELLPVGMSREDVLQKLANVEKGQNPDNTLLKIDRNGKIEKEFSVMHALFDAGLEAAIHDGRTADELDPVHLNDIEIVTPALAAKIAGVDSGDLLISLRNMSMLAILDQDDGSLKWHKRGPWVRQHDPDITPDGRIELFNNRSVELTSFFTEGSQILSFDPASNETEVLFPKGKKDRFSTWIMGAHQHLANGNRLIVESTKGRVFEVTASGDVVWSYVLGYDDEYAALMESAQRIPRNFFSAVDWQCNLS